MTTARASKTAKRQTLTRREFFEDLTGAVRHGLSGEMQAFHSRHTMNLLKIHYGANYRIHYEAWINTDTGFVELGLHFEDGPESTSRLLEHFDRRVVEIKHELGTHCELERWTKSWGHLYETHPIEPLNDAFIQKLAERLIRMIDVLQPILDEAYDAGIAPTTPRPSTFRQRFRGRR
ncbi:MAG: hypothetical protein H0V47_03300 [Chloroflexia bacterium]|jgi:hypothetical protein|nr:hypothetical protein [Chloroflexia bacterium]